MKKPKPIKSRHFQYKGIDFEITGTRTDEKGQTWDDVKNVKTGEWKPMRREKVLSFIKTEDRRQQYVVQQSDTGRTDTDNHTLFGQRGNRALISLFY